VSTCTIYYPGLLGPDVPLEDLPAQDWPQQNQLNHLCKLFSHGRASELLEQGNKRSIEARILSYLGVTFDDGEDVPVAHVRSQQHEYADEPLWCLDPVHIQIGLDEAILLANEALNLTEKEARHLIQDINQHFEQDDLYIHYCAPHQWMLKGNFELSTRTLSEVMYNNIYERQPEGRDEKQWRRIVNEMQMLLHSHPVNLERAEHGKLLVNSLWLWGGGRYNTMQTPIELVYGDHALIANVAAASDIPHKDLPIKLNPQGFQGRATLMIFTEQVHAIHDKDVFGWFEHLKHLDQRILSPLFDMLKQDQLEKLTVQGDNITIMLTKKDLKKWWRRTNSVSHSFLQMRNTYGY